MLSVQHNMLAGNASRQFKVNTKKNAKCAEKLSSGYRINRSADDAAGLAISEKMRRQIRGLHQAADNISEGIGYVQTAEGALNEVQDMLQRMNELAVKAGNDTNTEEDRSYIDSEVQALKKELDRIFETTTFNERRIWDPDSPYAVQIGTTLKQAVEYKNGAQNRDVTNANCGVLAYNGYNISADDTGVSVSWIGYDGNSYSTRTIDWDTLKANNYSFEMSDYFGDKTAGNLLYDSNGNPVFKNKVSLSVQKEATVDDIIQCIDGTKMSSSSYASMSVRFEKNNGSSTSTAGVSIGSASLYYSAAYASNHNVNSNTNGYGHNFEAADDKFLEPSDGSGTLVQTQATGGNLTKVPAGGTADVAIAQNCTDNWEFTFYMDGIGEVTATSDSVRYYNASETEDKDEHIWWDWSWYWKNGKKEYYKSYNIKSSTEKGAGTLGSVMAALNGDNTTNTPGLLNPANGGACNEGGTGYINIYFSLKSTDSYTYGNGQTSNNVGSFTITVSVNSKTDTEQSVLNRINSALNSNTIVDLYTTSGTNDSNTIHEASEKSHKIDVPVYGGTCGFFVQAGTEGGQHIEVLYDFLSVKDLGLEDTNVLTREDTDKAIDEIKQALTDVSRQRSTFGAYQNRLEHAYNINKNVEENTQASEAVIRDTDIAERMVEYSNNNILQQAGASMLAQANQQPNYVLQLLQ